MTTAPIASFASFASSTLCARLAVALVVALTSVAHAQSANQILDESRQAIAEISGFDAQFRMQGEGGSMFADTMPSMSGKVFFGTHSEFGKLVHALGEGKDKQTDPSKPIDILIARDRYIWVDRAKQEIIENPKNAGTRGAPSAITLVLIDTIINDDPYAQDANNAESITLGAQEQVGGVLCDQIVIKRAKPTGNTRNTAENYTDAIWWIAVEDKLPRKVHRITDAGLVKITLSFEMSNLKVSEPNDEQLDVRRPENFRFISRMPSTEPRAEPDAQPTEPGLRNPTDRGTGDAAAPTRDEPESPRAPRAPSFSFTTSEGALINSSSQIDRVSVLYFWGSWCAPCTQTSPLIEELASQIDDPSLDVFALAIREGDPQQALRGFRQNHPTPRVSVNPEGVANAFKVRVFPSIVVLDRSGSIVFQRGIEREFGTRQLVEAAREAVSTALNES